MSKRRLMLSYGMNTCPRQMAQRCPAAIPVSAVVLADYALVFRGVADIVPLKGSVLHGVLWSITSACEKALDRLEGFPHLYIKRTVEVEDTDMTYRAFAYVMAAHASPYRLMIAPPSRFYHQTLRNGYAHFGLPLSQIEDAVEAADRIYLGEISA